MIYFPHINIIFTVNLPRFNITVSPNQIQFYEKYANQSVKNMQAHLIRSFKIRKIDRLHESTFTGSRIITCSAGSGPEVKHK